MNKQRSPGQLAGTFLTIILRMAIARSHGRAAAGEDIGLVSYTLKICF